MTFPSFPTDSLYKFLFIAGLILIVYSKTVIENNTEKFRTSIYQFEKESIYLRIATDAQVKQKQLLLKQSNELLELLTNYQRRLEKGIIDNQLKEEYLKKNNEIKENEKQVSLLDVDASKKLKELNFILDQLRKLNDQLVSEENKLYNYQILGLILITIGLLGWFKLQYYQDRIIRKQYLDSNKDEQECQSCGMILRFDENYQQGIKFCSHCHDGKDYRNPDLTLDELKNQIKKRMKQQGFNFIFIWLRLSSLKQLDRWKQTFKW